MQNGTSKLQWSVEETKAVIDEAIQESKMELLKNSSNDDIITESKLQEANDILRMQRLFESPVTLGDRFAAIRRNHCYFE